MSVRAVRSPVSFRTSSNQVTDSIHKPRPPPPYSSTTYGSSRLTRDPSPRRPLPTGPGPLDDKGRRFRYTDYNANYTSSTLRPKKTSLPSTLGSSAISQPVRATDSSDTASYYSKRYGTSSRENLYSHGSLSGGTGSYRSQSITDISRETSRLRLDDPPARSSGYRETSFRNISDRLDRPKLSTAAFNNSTPSLAYHGTYHNQYSEPKSYTSSYLSSPSPPSRLSRHESFPSPGSHTSDSETSPSPRDRSRSSSVTRKFNRSTSLLSPLNNSIHSDKEGLVGLSNLGNTCFLNAIVQCLSHINSLLEYCLKENFRLDLNEDSTTKGQLIQAYSHVMNSLWKPNGDRYFSPRQFKGQVERFAKQFAGYSQQDAQEFLRFLLEGLHEDVNTVKKKPRYNTEIPDELSDSEKAKEAWQRYKSREQSHISQLFVGQLKSTLECCTCRLKSVTFDPFWDLSIPIPRDQTTVSLDSCLQHFTRSEVLDKEEKPMCSRCKSHQVSTKKLSIQRFPRVLVIHLKRFSGRKKLSTLVDFPLERLDMKNYAAGSYLKRFSGKKKLSTLVDFPLERLDMKNYAAGSCRDHTVVYNLQGTVNHFGSIYGGHYVAMCKHAKQQKWHRYDDERVETVSSAAIRSSQAYVLFYEQDGASTLTS